MITEKKPIIIAGPCAAESWDVILEVALALKALSESLDFEYFFKASFDKANRTAHHGARGPGLPQAKKWFSDLKTSLGVKILTDVHESQQVPEVAEICDVLQIPAFLCRQTDLVSAAIKSGRHVNIKKGQFLAPQAMCQVAHKALEAQNGLTADQKAQQRVFLTERGVSFGYGNLIVDMRAFPVMAATKLPLILDVTHSTQLPAMGQDGGSSSAQRSMAPILARAATATGYLSGYFLEVHPTPHAAISDRDAQLSIPQATMLLQQLVPLWKSSSQLSSIDGSFQNS